MLFIVFLLVVVAIGLVAAAIVRPAFKLPVFLSTGAVAAILTVFNVFVVVPTEQIYVERFFGETMPGYLAPGLHLVNPISTFQDYEALRREFPVETEALASDNNALKVQVGFATKLNPAIAYRIQESVGADYFAALVIPAGQTAVRTAIAGFTWTTASTSSRGEVQLAIQSQFERIVVEQLRSSGLTEEESRTALQIMPVQLRQIDPDEKVKNAVAEKTASEQDLDRQVILTNIAAQEALRRGNEGQGVKNLFDNLPSGFTAGEIATVLSAIADKTRSDAMLKAVESGQVDTILMNGDTASNVSVPAQPAAAPDMKPVAATAPARQ